MTVIWILVYLATGPKGMTTGQVEFPEDRAACQAAEEKIKQELKTPGTTITTTCVMSTEAL